MHDLVTMLVHLALFLGPTGFYVLENLYPTTTYDLRFASKNLVGFSVWGAGKRAMSVALANASIGRGLQTAVVIMLMSNDDGNDNNNNRGR